MKTIWKQMVWLLLGVVLVDADAQWVQEQVRLEPGWNAVYLTVQPEPANCDELLAGVPEVESVWRWNRRFTPVDFDVDPADPLTEADAWLRWYPADHPYRALRNMYELQGLVAHLIRVDTNTAAFDWVVTGRPLLPSADWFEYQLNLVGMAVDAENAPTFNTYFADVPEVGVLPDVDEGEIYEVNAAAGGDQILQPARTDINRNQAYWMLCGDKTDYAGPLQISMSPNTLGILDFGSDGVEATLTIQNVLTNRMIRVRINREASAEPPDGQPADAGIPPLSYYGTVGTNGAAWIPWTEALEQDIAAGDSWVLPLCVWRSEMATNTAGVYQCILDVKESTGLVRCRIPVRAEVEN